MPSDSVVLLHGLGRRAASLARMRSALTAEGYRVFALDYPSTRHDLPTLTATLPLCRAERGERHDPWRQTPSWGETEA